MKSKIKDRAELAKLLADAKARGKTVVFTNGCFDILHAGHVDYLEKARSLGDVLVVAVNSDSSVRRIKGPKRPIISQEQRTAVLAGLGCVDFVVIFSEPDPAALISELVPNVLVKGADWPADKIVGADTVLAAGGRVERIEMLEGVSTSQIIERIKQRS
ncbi:MAG: D-glycero-beta-D-manno-heptose 1-phosphate adenylyltransferase [Desulfatibacillaceae bacterium]|nr:D-glycero-beta-D-manno-heptose 1-phosphate adenylyltransferase [Desulfatibacillaceae bacterium]